MKWPVLSVMLFAFNAYANIDVAKSMVPRGKILETLGRDFIVKTTAGTKIGIEFTRSGDLEEAFGKNLNQGDELEPGDGLISLSSAAQIMQNAGLKPAGYWLLEKDHLMGWIYEVNGTIISAKTGAILKKTEISISENASEDISRTYHQTP